MCLIQVRVFHLIFRVKLLQQQEQQVVVVVGSVLDPSLDDFWGALSLHV